MSYILTGHFNNPFILRAVSFVALMVAVTQNAFACTADEITLSNNSCIPVKFKVETISMNKDFSFNFSAAGIFYIDWGDGNVETLNRTNNTSATTISHTYSGKGARTIKFGGVATGYNTSSSTSVMTFSNNQQVKKALSHIEGSLTDLFPEFGSGAGQHPSFYNTFNGCQELTNIPENLFRGITHADSNQFYRTFSGCSSLSGFIPPSAFGGLIQANSPYATNMMSNIFYQTGLDTTCSSPHRTYTTGYESYWSSKVSCGTEYTLTYVMNGGTNYAGAPTTFWDDEATTINGVPTKTDNVFSGWCSDAGLTDCAMSYTIPIYTISPQTIYAKWTPCTACATTNASCTLSVVNNTCTYTTACNPGYENIQNNGQYNASCTPISGTMCSGGVLSQQRLLHTCWRWILVPRQQRHPHAMSNRHNHHWVRRWCRPSN